MIVYLDDITVLNQTREEIFRDRDSTIWLLQYLGFVINWKKSVLDPSHCMEYLGFGINSLEMNLSLPKEKNQSTHPVLQRPDSGKNCLRQNPGENNWETDFVNAGCSPCTLALPILANDASERSASRDELRDNGTSQPELSERPSMVVGSDFHLEWSVNNYSSPRSGNNDRCITAGLGSSLPRGSHGGTLVSVRIKHPSYQCIGAESSIVCCESFHCQRKAVACPSENGQQDSSGLCIENGGDMILGIGRDSPGIMGLCPEQTNYSDSRLSSWKIQSRGRLGVQALP